MLDGTVYELPTAALHTEGIDGGLWPTPTANQQAAATIPALLNEAMRLHPRGQWTLATQVAAEHVYKRRMWPTPSANEDAAEKPTGKMQAMLGNHPDIRSSGTGTLNPAWVAWLMGWPIGHAFSRLWGTVKFHCKRRSRGKS
jgi:hypothetical protein